MNAHFNDTETLQQALARAAGELARQSPPLDPPAAVLQALARRTAPARRGGWRIAWAGGGLAVATLALAVGLLASAPREAAVDPRHAAAATPFLPVGASAERWPQLLREAREHGPAWVVPTEMPRESLAALGLPYDPARAGQPVRAELLVHANGDVLAVRFVR